MNQESKSTKALGANSPGFIWDLMGTNEVTNQYFGNNASSSGWQTFICSFFLAEMSFTCSANFLIQNVVRIRPPHSFPIDSRLAQGHLPHFRTATVLWTSPFPLNVATLFLANLSTFSFCRRAMSGPQ